MAQADRYVTETRTDIVNLLDLIEAAQAIAAARVQETLKLGGITIINDFNWDDVEMSKQEFIDAVQALQNDFPDLLGDAGEALYPVKTKLA